MNGVPEFPTFKTASLADRSDYEKFYKRFDPYSDFGFNNLWIWFNQQGQLAFSRYESNLIIRFNNPFDNGARDFTILGNFSCERTILRLLRWLHAMSLRERLIMVPQIVIDNTKNTPPAFTITEDRNNYDYICDIGKTVAAAGSEYTGYRRALSSFRRRYGVPTARELDAKNPDQCGQLLTHMHDWSSANRNPGQTGTEGPAVQRALHFASELSTRCLGIFLDDTLIAFLLYQIPPQGDYAIANHLIYDHTFDFVFDVSHALLVQHLHDAGLSFINIEQDLGIAGIRAHKQRLRPYCYLKRYTVTL